MHIDIIVERKVQHSKPDMEHKTHKKRPKSRIVRTVDDECAYLTVMAVLIIFPFILQTVINLRMPSIGERVGAFRKVIWHTFW